MYSTTASHPAFILAQATWVFEREMRECTEFLQRFKCDFHLDHQTFNIDLWRNRLAFVESVIISCFLTLSNKLLGIFCSNSPQSSFSDTSCQLYQNHSLSRLFLNRLHNLLISETLPNHSLIWRSFVFFSFSRWRSFVFANIIFTNGHQAKNHQKLFTRFHVFLTKKLWIWIKHWSVEFQPTQQKALDTFFFSLSPPVITPPSISMPIVIIPVPRRIITRWWSWPVVVVVRLIPIIVTTRTHVRSGLRIVPSRHYVLGWWSSWAVPLKLRSTTHKLIYWMRISNIWIIVIVLINSPRICWRRRKRLGCSCGALWRWQGAGRKSNGWVFSPRSINRDWNWCWLDIDRVGVSPHCRRQIGRQWWAAAGNYIFHIYI